MSTNATQERCRTAHLIAKSSIVAGVAFAIFFHTQADLDIAVAHQFYSTESGFVGERLDWVIALRNIFKAFFIICLVGAVIGCVVTRKQSAWRGLSRQAWVFVLACLIVGPGLVANTIFKDQWGRPRPAKITEFGGRGTFQPPLVISNQCHRNCSFFSGEVATTMTPFAAAALLFPHLRITTIASGLALSAVSGAIRVSQGGHFVSDVVFACLFMLLTVATLHILMVQGRLWAALVRADAWWRGRSLSPAS